LVDDARSRGALVLGGGGLVVEQSRLIEPTVILDAPLDSKVMTEEIFGPVLPIQTFDETDGLLRQVRSAPKPLALFVYSDDEAFVTAVLAGTSSGGVTVNGWVAAGQNKGRVRRGQQQWQRALPRHLGLPGVLQSPCCRETPAFGQQVWVRPLPEKLIARPSLSVLRPCTEDQLRPALRLGPGKDRLQVVLHCVLRHHQLAVRSHYSCTSLLHEKTTGLLRSSTYSCVPQPTMSSLCRRFVALTPGGRGTGFGGCDEATVVLLGGPGCVNERIHRPISGCRAVCPSE